MHSSDVMLAVDLSCPVCGEGLETIEHLFFQCHFVRKVWRASFLGFDFEVGVPVMFGEWFSKWLKEAPDKEMICDSILIMWVIWCLWNDAAFNNESCVVDP